MVGTTAHAERCPIDAMLTVTGKISRHNDTDGKAYRFTEASLMQLPVASLHTSTVWSPATTYSGPSLAKILEVAGASPQATQLHLVALDKFESWVPYRDVERYAPVVAHSMNGRRIDHAKYGPLYLVYPRDDHPELQNPKGESRFVWQVCLIAVR